MKTINTSYARTHTHTLETAKQQVAYYPESRVSTQDCTTDVHFLGKYATYTYLLIRSIFLYVPGNTIPVYNRMYPYSRRPQP